MSIASTLNVPLCTKLSGTPAMDVNFAHTTFALVTLMICRKISVCTSVFNHQLPGAHGNNARRTFDLYRNFFNSLQTHRAIHTIPSTQQMTTIECTNALSSPLMTISGDGVGGNSNGCIVIFASVCGNKLDIAIDAAAGVYSHGKLTTYGKSDVFPMQ